MSRFAPRPLVGASSRAGPHGYSRPPTPPSSPPVPPEPLTVLMALGTPAEQDTIMVTELAMELKVTRAIATGPRITVPDS